jgi:hypothetical protein
MCISTHIGAFLPDLFTNSSSPFLLASASLRLLYSLLYSVHNNHIQVLAFLPFLYSSRVWSPLSVWPMSNNVTAFALGVYSAYEGARGIFWPSEPD